MSEKVGFFKKFKDNFTLGIIGIVISFIGLLGTLIGLYPLFHSQKANISFEIVNETNVLDIHKSLNDLSILFQGENIQKNNLNLKLFTVKVENIGDFNITQNDYDKNDLWGLNVGNGKIIEAHLSDSNSDYISKFLNPEIVSNNTVSFNKIIFEKKKSFNLELLILHSKDIEPALSSIGKIAGIDKVEITKYLDREKKSLWDSIWYGDSFVISLRFLIDMILFFLIGLITITLSSKQEQFMKYKNMRKIRKLNWLNNYQRKDLLINLYTDQGIDGLKFLHMALTSNKLQPILKNHELRDKFKIEIEALKQELPPSAINEEFILFSDDPIFKVESYDTFLHNLEVFLETGVLKRDEEGKVEIDQTFVIMLNKLISLIDKKHKIDMEK